MDAARQPKLEAKAVKLAFYNERMKRRLQVLDGIDLSRVRRFKRFVPP